MQVANACMHGRHQRVVAGRQTCPLADNVCLCLAFCRYVGEKDLAFFKYHAIEDGPCEGATPWERVLVRGLNMTMLPQTAGSATLVQCSSLQQQLGWTSAVNINICCAGRAQVAPSVVAGHRFLLQTAGTGSCFRQLVVKAAVGSECDTPDCQQWMQSQQCMQSAELTGQ